MAQIINCIADKTKFNDLNSRALQHIKDTYNSDADKWCNPIIHPVSGDIAFTVEDKILPCLTDAEKAEIIELTSDWFPKDEL